MIGTDVGNYRIIERLGDGGMGAVFRAVDRMLDREVAIKVLRPELASNAALIERFRLEAVVLARLNHPRIATLHGLERHEGSFLMIMEYVRGDTLEAIVQRSGRLDWRRAAELCAAVLDALDHAHDKGVVHRDIKPANIMLSSAGAVKVMDFGIARLVGRNRQTQVGHAVGTPTYMAPEQLRGEEVDGRTDLYAVGAVLFELVTGRMAFEADSDYAMMMKQLNEPPPAASTLVADVPAELDAAIACAMAKRRDERFANAVAFREALEAMIAAHGAPSRRTPLPGATRLAPSPDTPPPSTIVAPPAPPSVQETNEHATRIAAEPAPTRLAEFGVASASRNAGVRWERDWKSWASIAAVVVAVAVFAQSMRSNPTPDRQDVVSRPDSVAVAVTPRPEIALPPSPPVERASDLRVSSGGGGSLSPTPSEPSPIIPRSGSSSGTPPSLAPTRTAGAPPSARAGRGSDQGSAHVDPPPPPAPTPDPAPAAPARPAAEESTEDASTAIADALSRAAAALSGSETGAARALLDGNVQQQWTSLMQEGRVSMRVEGSPDLDVRGARATAQFEASVNVRSPFGANRRRSARFTATLARTDGRWRVTELRPQGSLELK